MSRLDKLSENNLWRRIADIRLLVDELKTKQYLGSSSVRPVRVFSGSSYDIEVDTIGFNNKVVEITFTPTDSTTSALGLVYRMEYTATYSTIGAVAEFGERLLPVGNQQKWRLYLEGNDGSPVAWARYKFYFFGNGGGTFTTQLV